MYSKVRYTGTGSQTLYPVNFPFISRSHVGVFVNDVPRSFQWLNDGLVLVEPAPGAGTEVVIRRNSNRLAPLVVFNSDSVLTQEALETANKQAIYIAQEAIDESSAAQATLDAQAAAATAVAAANTATAAAATTLSHETGAGTYSSNAAASAATALGAVGTITNKWDLGGVNTTTAAQRAVVLPNVTYDLDTNTRAASFEIKPASTLGTIASGKTNTLVNVDAAGDTVTNTSALIGVRSKVAGSATSVTGSRIIAGKFEASTPGVGDAIAIWAEAKGTTAPGSYSACMYARTTDNPVGNNIVAAVKGLGGTGMTITGEFSGITAPSVLKGFEVSQSVGVAQCAFYYQRDSNANLSDAFKFAEATTGATIFAVTGDGSLHFAAPMWPISDGQRINADFSNALPAKRLLFQTSMVNGASAPGVIPNGTATIAGYRGYNSSSVTNCGQFGLLISTVSLDLSASIVGSGSYVPITFSTGGAVRVRVETAGALVHNHALANQSYSRQVPTTGFTITIADNTDMLILHPAGTLATGTVTFPANPVDGQCITIMSATAVTALTLSGNGKTIVGAATTIAANGCLKYRYVAAVTTYYREQ